MNTIDIPISKLHISSNNTRQPTATDPGVKELAVSLAGAGQLAAILVRPHPNKKGHYEIAAGARRSVAAGIAGLKTLRASVTEMDEDTFQKAILADNIARENPDARAEAELIVKLHERGNTASDIASHMGKAESWVARRMKILKVDPKILKQWKDPEGDCHHFSVEMMELIGSLDKELQEELTEGWGTEDMKSRKDLERAIQRRSPSLENCPFDLHDPKYFVKGCGPGCASDTSEQPTIFGFKDGKKNDCARCLNGACFSSRLQLFYNAEYEAVCKKAGLESLPVITENEITIKGSRYRDDWQQSKDWSKTGDPVCYVDKNKRMHLKFLATKKEKGKDDAKEQASPEQKQETRINKLQGKRWLLVREKLYAFIAEATHANLSVDIDRVIATFGLPYKTEGSTMEPLDKPMWAQIFSKEEKIKCERDWNWKSAKLATREEALWPHVQDILIRLIPEPKRLMDVYLYENDYRCMGNLIGFDIEAAKKAADLEILPPKSFGEVDPHTLK
jgi:ParB/RepB/Spo0J family partition protein